MVPTIGYKPKYCKSALKKYQTQPPAKDAAVGKRLRSGGNMSPITNLRMHELKCRELMFEEETKGTLRAEKHKIGNHS